jgi:hypothetical protein
MASPGVAISASAVADASGTTVAGWIAALQPARRPRREARAAAARSAGSEIVTL